MWTTLVNSSSLAMCLPCACAVGTKMRQLIFVICQIIAKITKGYLPHLGKVTWLSFEVSSSVSSESQYQLNLIYCVPIGHLTAQTVQNRNTKPNKTMILTDRWVVWTMQSPNPPPPPRPCVTTSLLITLSTRIWMHTCMLKIYGKN